MKFKNILITLMVLISLSGIASAEEVSWTNTKTVSHAKLDITAPQQFTTCIISPDGGTGWDTCYAYIIVKNNFQKLPEGLLNFNSLWKKGNTRDITYEYTKNIVDSQIVNSNTDENGTISYTYTPSKILTGFSSDIPSVEIGQSFAVKLTFQKKRWSTDSFDLTIRAGGTDITLDPDVDACGTLNVDGATYTLNQSVSSTGTCFTIEANNITFDGQYNWINHTNLTAGTGIYISGAKNTTIKNVLTYQSNSTPTSGIRGISFNNGANYSNIFNSTIISSSGGSLYIFNTSYVNLTNVTATTNSNFGILVQNQSNYNNLNNVYALVLNGSGKAISFESGSEYNSMFDSYANSSSGVGIYINSNNNTVINCSCISKTSNFGLSLISTSYNNIISNNCSSYSSNALQLSSSSSYNNIISNNANSITGIGIRLESSNNNTLIGNNASSNSSYGISLNSASYNNLSGNYGNTYSGQGGIRIISSIYNNLTSNFGYAKRNYGIYLQSINNSLFIDNIGLNLDGNEGGFQLLSSTGNNTFINETYYSINSPSNIEDLSINSVKNYDTFINTNWSLYRKLKFYAALDEFNQSQDSGSIFLNTNVTTARITNRSIGEWDTTSLSWSENWNGAETATYTTTVLLPTQRYNVFKELVLVNSTTTDASGQLNFTMSFSSGVQTNVTVLDLAYLNGTITGEDGVGVSGVSVIVSGSVVTTTNATGYYNTGYGFQLGQTYVITFSRTGYVSQSTTILFDTSLDSETSNVSGLVLTAGGKETITQDSIMTYVPIALPIMGLALMIYGFSIILFVMKSSNEDRNENSGQTVLFGITIVIIGFAILTLGAYIVYAIVGNLPQIP